MTRTIRSLIGSVIIAVGFAAVGVANGVTPPPPETGQATTSIQLPSITVTDAAGVTHTVDLGALTAQALTDTDLFASLGVAGGSLLGASLPVWQLDTTGGPQSGDHNISVTNGSAAANVGIVGYDVHTATQAAHSSLTSLTATAATTPLVVQVDLGQHGVDATVGPDTSSSAITLTVTGLSLDLGDLLPADVLDALPLSGLVNMVSALGLTLPAGAGGVVGALDALTDQLDTIADAAGQLADAQMTLANLLLTIPSTTLAQQQLTDAQTQLSNDLAALGAAQQQLGTDTTAAANLATQLAAQNADVATVQQQLDDANADVTSWTDQVNTLSALLTTLLADPLQAVQAALVAAQLADAQQQLADAQAAVTSAQATLSAAQATAAATQLLLAQANADVTADQQLVDSLQQQVTADQAAVTAAQSVLDDLVAQVALINQAVADAQSTVDQLTTTLSDLISDFNVDAAALPDLTALRTQLVAALTSAPLIDVGTLGATVSSSATDDNGTGTVTCTITGATVLGQPVPVGPCTDLVADFANVSNALAGAMSALPLGQPMSPVLGGLGHSTTSTNPTATDTVTTGAAGLTPLHLALPSAGLLALVDPAVAGLSAALDPTQQVLAGLGLPAVTSAITGPLGTLNTALAAMPTGASLAGLHTLGVDVSLVGLSTTALHNRSLPAAPAGGSNAVGGGGNNGGTDIGGGTTSDPGVPGGPGAPGTPDSHRPAGVTPPDRTIAHSPVPALPFTGDNAAVELATALILVLVGAHLVAGGRRRPSTSAERL
jgi:hypothetical protein